MPANVDTMFYYGATPWHGLGRRLDHVATAAEAIDAAGLDWKVDLVPLSKLVGGVQMSQTRRYAVIREDTKTMLSVVGDRYSPLQNRDAFRFFDSVVDEGAAIYHTAGSLKDGERVWILAKLPSSIEVVEQDITDKYLLLANAHTGRAAVRIKFTPIRVVCQNTLAVALAGAGGVRVSHVGNVLEKAIEAKDNLGTFIKVMEKTYDGIAELYRRLAAVHMAIAELRAYFDEVFPVTDAQQAAQVATVRKARRSALNLHERGRGASIPGVQGTLWGAYNAAVEHVDYAIRRKNSDTRLESVWFGDGDATKQRALDLAVQRLR